MTAHHDDDERTPDIGEARQAAEESMARAEEELQRAMEQAKRTLTLAQRLRRLREANGFRTLLDDAFGSSHG